MSSMVSRITLAALCLSAMTAPIACHAQVPSADGSDWDRARAALLSSQDPSTRAAIDRWERLRQTDSYPFRDYASFVVTYPGWPGEERFRRNAELAIDPASTPPAEVLAYFERFEPTTNTGHARYAIALGSTGQRDTAIAMAREAWRGGDLFDEDEAMLLGLFAGEFTPADYDARINSLLWANKASDASQLIGFATPARRDVLAARIALQRRSTDIDSRTSALGADALRDPGYIIDRAEYLRATGQASAARAFLASRLPLARHPADPNEWYRTLRTISREAANDYQWQLAYDIASKVDDAYPAGTEINEQESGVRDKYSDLVWLAGTTAFHEQGAPGNAIGMFDRYARSYNSPQIRSKGYYWAGRAALSAGQPEIATGYFEKAAEYPDYFYGQLAYERLGRELPDFSEMASLQVPADTRSAFNANSLTYAVREIARRGDWRTQNSFFQAITDSAETPADHQLIIDLARDIGRRDLAVIAGLGARNNGIDAFQQTSFPQMPVPRGFDDDWSLIHAITRQESQFAQNALSHANAHGLMQLIPSTAREQAGKIGLSYSYGGLTSDAEYNIRLGSTYYERMRAYFGGSYPLAAAAYNAGAGNVNKWLRANGDPRTGQISMLEWIEKIPIFETRNYVQRVMENAVVYDSMHPERAHMHGPNKLSQYLGKAPG